MGVTRDRAGGGLWCPHIPRPFDCETLGKSWYPPSAEISAELWDTGQLTMLERVWAPPGQRTRLV